MSFRLFIYYCALIGAWTAMVGWILGRYLSDRFIPADETVKLASVRAATLGLCVAFGLGLVDAFWSAHGIVQALARLLVAMIVGALGGLAGGSLAQWLVVLTGHEIAFFVLGWTVAGLIMGASVSAFEWIGSVFGGGERQAARRKFVKCMVGGCLGGLVGGVSALALREGWLRFFGDKEPALLWSPTAIGFVTLGLCIGLLVGLAQVVLREAWVKVEAGFRPGREVILAKERTLIGRAEGSDIPMFGDQAVDKTHAAIIREGGRYLVEDTGSTGGTFINERKVTGKAPLRSGDLIRVGKSVLRFSVSEKMKR